MPPHPDGLPPRTHQWFELAVPAEPDHVATIRLFVATVARALDLDEELVEDLKLGVSELATAVVTSGNADRMEVVGDHHDGRLAISVGPITARDLTAEAIDPVEVVVALFPGTHRDPSASTVVIPVDPETAWSGIR